MKGQKEQLKKIATESGAKMVAKAMWEATDNLTKKMEKSKSPKEVMGLTDAMVEGIYGQAYRLYNTGKFDEAIKIFRMLVMMNSTEPKYSMGLAACFHMKKNYKAAVDAYAIVQVIDPNNPVPFYHLSDCFIQMGDLSSACYSLEMAVKRAADKPEFKALKEKATLTIESLKKEIVQNKGAAQSQNNTNG